MTTVAWISAIGSVFAALGACVAAIMSYKSVRETQHPVLALHKVYYVYDPSHPYSCMAAFRNTGRGIAFTRKVVVKGEHKHRIRAAISTPITISEQDFAKVKVDLPEKNIPFTAVIELYYTDGLGKGRLTSTTVTFEWKLLQSGSGAVQWFVDSEVSKRYRGHIPDNVEHWAAGDDSAVRE